MNKILLKKEVWLPIIVLVVVGSLIYSFNLNNKLFWDDDDWIINNSFVHQISWDNIKFWLTNNALAGVGSKSDYYRPFLFFTFALNYVISGINPLGYHLFSNLIHLINGILVFFVVRQIFKNKLISFLTSLIFLIHPLQTEAVTYISGRGDVLVTFFMLLSLWLFSKAEIQNLGWTSKKKILSVLFLILGLLSRETGIVFPFLALVYYVAFISSKRFIVSVKDGFIKTWPYFVVVLVYGILRLTVLNFINTLNFYSEPNLYSENLYVRLFTFFPILGNYIKLLFIPTGLHMERSAIVYTSLLQWPVWPIILGLIGLLAWLIYLYRYQSATFRIWFFGMALFFISLAPVSGITPINALIYEHWLYLPMIGFWLIISFYIVKLFDYLKHRKLPTFYLLIATSFLLVYLSFFGYQAIKRNILWGNQAKFFEDILKYEPDSSRINNNLGNMYFNQGNKEQAEFYYKKAVDSSNSFAQPYYNLGTILQSRGDFNGAIRLYEKAIEINPGFYYSYQNLSVIYAQQGNLAKAVENIETLKLLLPNNPRVYYNSALIYAALNKREQALKDLRIGLKYIKLDSQTEELINELIIKLQK